MIELSAILKKPVLDVTTSCILGKVTDVYFDENCKCAVYFCIAENSGKYMLLPFAEVQSFSDALVVTDGVGLISPNDADITVLRTGILNMPVYTLGGIGKGCVRDVAITSTGKVSRLRADEEEFAPSAILKIGDVILLKPNAKTKQRATAKSRKIPRPETEYPVYILNEAQSSEPVEKAAATADIAQPKPVFALNADMREPVLSDCALKSLIGDEDGLTFDDTHTPTRIICDYEFLLGRTLGANLCTYTGELIAAQGSSVTSAIVEQARRAGKLVELTLNSIKPVQRTQSADKQA